VTISLASVIALNSREVWRVVEETLGSYITEGV